MRFRITKGRLRAIVGVMAAVILLGTTAFTFVHVQMSHAQQTGFKVIGTPRFYTFHHNWSAAQLGVNDSTRFAHFNESFKYNGTTYNYSMVGTDPVLGSKTSTVPVELVPLIVQFSSGHPLNGSLQTANTVASPLFKNAAFANGTTQYGDAMQRAEFWKLLQQHNGSNYHALLGQPTVSAAKTLTVPAANGFETTAGNGVVVGEVDINWWDAQIQHLIDLYDFSTAVLPIFLTYNVVLYQGSSSSCCIIGYHSTYNRSIGVVTYAWSSYMDAGIFPSADHIQDIDPLSHEVAEWYNDPFTNNTVPVWNVPSEPQYGCSNILEVGDPLVGHAFVVNGYHPQDVAAFSWFARQSPSWSYNGRYDYLGLFTTFSSSSGC
jgi:hypothetical protein